MSGTVVRNIHRAEAGAIATLERLGVSTVHEAQGRSGLMAPYMRPVWRGARIAGSAVTALCHPGDNWMIHVACDVVKKGDILVVACSSENTDGALRRAARHLAQGARREGRGARHRLPRLRRDQRDEVPALVARHLGQGHGQGEHRLGQRARGLRGREREAGRRSRRRRRRGGGCAAPRGRQGGEGRARSARRRKPASRARLQKGEIGLDIYDMRKSPGGQGPQIRRRAAGLKALLGDYPVTKHFKEHSSLEFADVKVPNTAFKRVVRDLEFDVAELAIMTFLLAKAHGKPYRLLPAVRDGALPAFHPGLQPRARRALARQSSRGRRSGMRSYSVTTATWVRGILADDYGVDLGKVQWVTFEDPHVAGVPRPAQRARACRPART